MRDDDLPQCRDVAAGEVNTIAAAQAELLEMREDFGGAKVHLSLIQYRPKLSNIPMFTLVSLARLVQ